MVRYLSEFYVNGIINHTLCLCRQNSVRVLDCFPSGKFQDSEFLGERECNVKNSGLISSRKLCRNHTSFASE